MSKYFRVRMNEGVEVVTGASSLNGVSGFSLNLNTPQAALLIASLAASEDFNVKPEERNQLSSLATKIAGRWSGY